MKIKKQVLEKIKKSSGIRGRLCAELDKTHPTIQKWVEENGEGLTLAASLKILREELNLTDDQILEETKNQAA